MRKALSRIKVDLCIDNVPPDWLKHFMGASPARKWIMMTNAHLQKPPMEVSFSDPVIVTEGVSEGQEERLP